MVHKAQRNRIGSKHLLSMGVVSLWIGLAQVGFVGGCGGSSGHGVITGAAGSAGGGAGTEGPGGAGGAGHGGATAAGAGGAGGGLAQGAGGAQAGGAGGADAGGASGSHGSGGTGGTTDPGPVPGTGGNGTFSWTGNGQSESGTGYYEEAAMTGGNSFVITIASESQSSGASCTLVGQFPTVPPTAGFYPMADITTPQVDGSFVGRCSQVHPYAADDESLTGQVAIAQATPGLVEGSFTMHAARHIPGTGGSSGEVLYSGAFSVGCRDGRPASDPSCGARSTAP